MADDWINGAVNGALRVVNGTTNGTQVPGTGIQIDWGSLIMGGIAGAVVVLLLKRDDEPAQIVVQK